MINEDEYTETKIKIPSINWKERVFISKYASNRWKVYLTFYFIHKNKCLKTDAELMGWS